MRCAADSSTSNRTKAISETPTDKRLIKAVFGLERHEYRAFGWSFAYFSSVLTSYYMLRPVREAMGVESGVGTIPILFTSTFVVMIFATSIFGFIASRYPRRSFLPWVYVFFAANILIFYLVFNYAEANDLPIVWIGRVFFVWLSVFNLFAVSVFWSFMADIYTQEQARRLFGIISAGGSLGAFAGPALTGVLVVPLGFENLFPISAALLLFSVICIRQLRHWTLTDHAQDADTSVASGKPIGGSAFAGFTNVIRSRYLTAIVGVSVIASLLGTGLYMFMNALVADAIEGTDARTRLFAIIDAATALTTTLIQALVVRHSVKRLGIGITLAILPVVSIIGFALLAANPTIMFVAILQGLRRAIGFGFAKPTSDMLYSVVPLEEKYKAKNFIDTAVYRGGDLIGTWSVKLLWGLGITGIALVMIPFALLWTGIAMWLGREYRQRDSQKPS